jgi:uncharacterized protein YecE (DUF72 family)
LKNSYFCILSAPGLPSDIVVTGKFADVRFHGVDSWYDYHYSQEELKEWAQQIKKLKADAFAYFNNDVDAYAPYNALELGKMLKGLSLVRDSQVMIHLRP